MTYSYRNQALIDLPMRHAQHDIAHQTGVQLMVDGDMEAAGTAAWGTNDSTLTKDTTAPLYGDSTQHLRITSTGNTFWATQLGILTVGRTYRITGVARTVSGAAIPAVVNAAAIWIGVVDTDWQPFDITFVAAATGILIGSYSNDPAVVDFDDVRLEQITPRILNLGTAGSDGDMTFGDGDTPIHYPTKLNRKGYSSDGNDDFKGVASVYTTTGLLDSCSLGVVCKFPDNDGDYAIAAYEDGVTLGMTMLNVSGDLRFYLGGVVANNAARIAITPGVFHSLVGVWDGTNNHIYLDGTHHAVAVTPVAPNVTAAMRSSIFERGRGDTPCVAGTEIAQYSLWNFALSATQANDFHIEMMKKIGKI